MTVIASSFQVAHRFENALSHFLELHLLFTDSSTQRFDLCGHNHEAHADSFVLGFGRYLVGVAKSELADILLKAFVFPRQSVDFSGENLNSFCVVLELSDFLLKLSCMSLVLVDDLQIAL